MKRACALCLAMLLLSGCGGEKISSDVGSEVPVETVDVTTLAESSEDVALGERPTFIFEYDGIGYYENLDGFFSGAFLQRADRTAELYVSENVSPVMEGEKHLVLDVVTDYAENEYIDQWIYADILWERYMLPDGRILCISDYEDESAEHLLNEGDSFKMMLLFAPFSE